MARIGNRRGRGRNRSLTRGRGRGKGRATSKKKSKSKQRGKSRRGSTRGKVTSKRKTRTSRRKQSRGRGRGRPRGRARGRGRGRGRSSQTNRSPNTVGNDSKTNDKNIEKIHKNLDQNIGAVQIFIEPPHQTKIPIEEKQTIPAHTSEQLNETMDSNTGEESDSNIEPSLPLDSESEKCKTRWKPQRSRRINRKANIFEDTWFDYKYVVVAGVSVVLAIAVVKILKI